MAEKKKKSEPEYIFVEFNTPRKYRWSTGPYVGKMYHEARMNKKLYANQCPKCKKMLWEPQVVCGRCKVETGWKWKELPQRGTVMQYTFIVYPMWDPHYGEKFANPLPNAMIEMDDGTVIRHFLEETDEKKLKEGMRVEAVWKENEEDRGEGTADIKFFRTIDK